MIFLSIVIPVYNSKKTIIPLLDSILESRKVNFGQIELILVDDKSKDNSVKLIRNFLLFKSQSLKECRLICLKKNSGPAQARNIGVKYAHGKIVLFLDADVVVYKDTLYEIVRSFKSDIDLYALTGAWNKKQNSQKFFPKFKALRDWSYWINERDPKNYYYLFSTRIAAINRSLFLRLGGFDTSYKAALVEDIELTYRIAKKHAVVFNPKVLVHHEFEDFGPIVKKYFWRSFYWSKIYRERKKFDPVATTSKEALTTISAFLLVFFALIHVFINFAYFENSITSIALIFILKKIFINLFYLFFIIHLWGVRKFIWFVYKEENLLFAVKSFFTGIFLYLVIIFGAVYSFFKD